MFSFKSNILGIILLMLLIIFIIGRRYSVQENLTSPPPTVKPPVQSCPPNPVIIGLKNTIDILSTKVDQMKSQMDSLQTTTAANKAQIDKYNQLIQQLEEQMKQEAAKK